MLRLPRRWFLFGLAVGTTATAADLRPATKAAFEHYAKLTEQQIDARLRTGPFLAIEQVAGLRARVKAGEVYVAPRQTLENGQEIQIPDGAVRHWLGAVFIPNVTLEQVKRVAQDYNRHQEVYRPDVIASSITAHAGDDFDIFLRLYQKQVITVVLNTNHHVHYSYPAPQQMVALSRSTRIAEVVNANRSMTLEKPVEHDNGFMWRLNSYGRFLQADGGVYFECEAVSLSRDAPAAIAWMIGSFIKELPRRSMMSTLTHTRDAFPARATADRAAVR